MTLLATEEPCLPHQAAHDDFTTPFSGGQRPIEHDLLVDRGHVTRRLRSVLGDLPFQHQCAMQRDFDFDKTRRVGLVTCDISMLDATAILLVGLMCINFYVNVS